MKSATVLSVGHKHNVPFGLPGGLVECLARTSPCDIELSGAWGAAKSKLVAQIAEQIRRPVLVIGAGRIEAEEISDDLATFASREKVILFPAWQTLPHEKIPPSDEIVAERMAALLQLDTAPPDPPYFIVTSVRSMLQLIPSRDELMEASVDLRNGDTISMSALAERLFELGYEREPAVEQHGEMSLRGGILDLFPISSDTPCRIEFFGDKIESIRSFDPETQISVEAVDRVRVLPRSEREFRDKLLRAGEVLVGLADYLPDETLVVYDEPQALIEEAEDAERQLKEGGGWVPWQHARQALSNRACLSLSQLVGVADAGRRFRIDTRSMASWEGDLALFWKELEHWKDKDYKVVLVCHNEGEEVRLRELLEEHGYDMSESADGGWIEMVIGTIRPGFSSPPDRFAVVSGKEIFGRRYWRRRSRRFKRGLPIVSLTDLQVGDYVVHVHHGIGRYQGIRRFEDKKGEFLAIEYLGGDKLYVPTVDVGSVQKYVGADAVAPTLNKLGGTAWARTKARVKKAVREMTQELLELYAARQTLEGHAFAPDTEWQKEFEDTFEYEETPDQQQAIEDVKADMEQRRPMDRLICGDVGYGKTEVAVRAAFKVVMDGKQVAILVPTTILAQQHFSTFSQRLADFPVNVEMLSRFRSRARQKRIIEGLESGTIDIVIGTHRLFSKDVAFKDLGLVVVDEEQRFGVAHKEKLKQMRKLVDVLTLSATPIPRTLHLSLMGVRDMSVIGTPPSDRLAVRTIVCRFDTQTIKEAIDRELAREGQVFFVHNRVQTIYSMSMFVQRLVPKARVAVAHGQLHEHELERVMDQFLAKQIDVLVTTTIIESGLDIPNVNTIVIDRADCFGLSELYQLRGRVGRYKHRAFAYLTVPGEQALSEVAQKRLKAIEDFSELGSGFRLALRDLEIRGAGNILGPQQHGHIVAVGLEMYCGLVEEASRELLGKTTERLPLPLADLAVDAYLPDAYIGSAEHKIHLYKRLSRIRDIEKLDDLRQEMRDRFGEPPREADALLEVTALRILGARLGLELISKTGDTALLRFRANVSPDLQKLSLLPKPVGRLLSILPGEPVRIVVQLDGRSNGSPIETLKAALNEMVAVW